MSEEVSKIDLIKEEVAGTSSIVGDLVLEFEKILDEGERKTVEDMIRDSRETWFPAKLIIKWEEKGEERIIRLVAVGGVNYVTLYDKGDGYYEGERLFLLIKTIKDVFPSLSRIGFSIVTPFEWMEKWLEKGKPVKSPISIKFGYKWDLGDTSRLFGGYGADRIMEFSTQKGEEFEPVELLSMLRNLNKRSPLNEITALLMFSI